MKLDALLAASLSVVALSLAGCAGDAAAPSQAVSGDEDELINGTIAGEDDFRPTILIQNTCTAVKVGPRKILTAAHCVNGQGGAELFDGGELVFFTANAVTDDTAASLAERATIETVVIHPNYTLQVHMADWPDVAVITVAPGSALDELPQAVVDLNPVALGTKVIMTGYGCSAIVPGGGNGDHILRSGTNKTASIQTLGLPYPAERLALIDENFVVAPGPVAQEDAVGLCPGDSGGPLFRSGASKLTVVGINSWTTGITQDGPRASMMVRLHEGSRHSVGEWLSQQGVMLTRACKDKERCSGEIADPR